MSLILDYGLDSPPRALLILVLSMQDRLKKTAMYKLHIHKTIKYFEYLKQQETIDFSNFKYGGVSYELQENLDTLEECGLIERIGSRYILRDIGKQAAKELATSHDEDYLRKLAFAKNQLNDLTHDEILFFMYKLLPDTQRYSTEFDRLNRDKEKLVRKLFLKGRINSTTAAKWLEVEKEEFLGFLSPSEAR